MNRLRLVLLLLVLGAGCPASEESQPARQLGAGEDSHQRMVQVLERVRTESRIDNGFLGEAPIPELLTRLTELPVEAHPVRWRVLRDLSDHELRQGRTEEAIAHLEEAHAMLPALAASMPPRSAIGTVLALGVAHLRDGENRNCRIQHNPDSCILPIKGKGVHLDRSGSEAALPHLLQVLEYTDPRAPEHLTALWLLNIAYMTLGEYPDGVPDAWRIDPEVYGDDLPAERFTNVASSLGIAVVDLAGGAVVEDFNGDGRLDLLSSTSDTAGGMHLFLGREQGGYEDASSRSGFEGMLGGLNMVAADYDNDGDIDIFVLRGGWWGAKGLHPNSLLQNNGKGYFRDVTFAVGLAEPALPTQTAAWSDFDADGDLDLYVGNEHQPGFEAPGQLFRNDGDGTFTDIAEQAGVANRRFAKAAVWGDIDEDGDPDLFLSNLMGRNRLYRNNGDATFTDIAEDAGVTSPIASFPAWFWDFNQDGHLDLFVSSYGGPQLESDVWMLAAGYLGRENPAENPIVYLGDGAGSFTRLPAEGPLARSSLPMGSNYGDVNNDGYPDVYLGTGYPQFEALMPNEMWLNETGRSLAQITVGSGLGHLQKGHGITFADLDRDGDLDIFEELGGAYTGDAFGNALFMNPGGRGGWLYLELQGVQSPRDGTGSRLAMTVSGPSGTRTIHQLSGGGGSFGVNPLRRVHFGLGDATQIDGLEIRWPSGLVQQVEGLEPGGFWKVQEGEPAVPMDYTPLPEGSFGL